MFYLNQSQYGMIKTFNTWFFGYLALVFIILIIYWLFNKIKHSQNKILRVLSLIFNKGFLTFSVAEMVVVPINIFTPNKPGLIKLSSLLVPTFAVLIVLGFAGAGICGGFYLEELQDEKLEDKNDISKYNNHMLDADTDEDPSTQDFEDTYMSTAHDYVPLNGPENIEENHRRHANNNKPENLKQGM